MGRQLPPFKEGIIVLTGTETLQIFSRMFVTPKENKELFTLTYNGITVSVSLVSSILVVLNPRLYDSLWRMQKTKHGDGKRMNTKTVTLFPIIELLSQSWLCTRSRVY